MNRKNLIARIVVSLFALVLFASVAAAQATETKSTKSSKMSKSDSAMSAAANADLMDINSASPDQLAPLPFHGMSRYPYPSTEHYPLTDERQKYFEKYNTRIVTSPVPRLLVSGSMFQGSSSRAP